MKKLTLSLSLFIGTTLLFSAFSALSQEVYSVDAQKSKILWVGQNVAGGKHNGELNLKSGQLNYKGNNLAGGEFTADINSIVVTDITGNGATRLANHLKNEDFFDTPKFPEGKFKITKVSGTGSDITITGDLTLKNITHSITFPAKLNKSGNSIHAVAKDIKIDRTKFDIKYRSGNFFSGLGDRAIADEFQLDVELFAEKK